MSTPRRTLIGHLLQKVCPAGDYANFRQRLNDRNQRMLAEGRRALELTRRSSAAATVAPTPRNSAAPTERFPIAVRDLSCTLTVNGSIELGEGLERAVDVAVSRTFNCLWRWERRGAVGCAPMLRININSKGGSLAPALAAYRRLCEAQSGRIGNRIGVHTHVTGDAFSAAGILAMAGMLRTAAPSARFMVHRPSLPQQPRDAETRSKAREMCGQLWDEIGDIYRNQARDVRRLKMGIAANNLADREIVFDAQSALYFTIIDRIV